MSDFPALIDDQIWVVNIIFKQLRENPRYLDDAPYPEDVKGWFHRQMHIEAAAPVTLKDLESEARDLYEQLKTIKGEMTSADVKDRLSYIKIATSLLEKLLIMQERATDVKAYANFQKNVLDVMQEILTPDQRTVVMDKLKALTT